MTDSDESHCIIYPELIVKLMGVIEKNQQMLLGMHKLLTPLLTPTFKTPSPDEQKRDLTPHVTGVFKQIAKDRENLARKTVLIEKIQDVLDAHYRWENENGIDD